MLNAIHNFLMADLQEQCICIEFCFIHGGGGGRKFHRSTRNAQKSYRWQCHGENADFWLVSL